jgi:MFS family permease
MVLLMRSRGVELPVIGALFALYSATVIVLELPTGSLADLLGRRRTLMTSRLLSVIGLVGMAVAPNPVALGAALVLNGVARALQSGPLEAWYVDVVRAADPEGDVRRGISRAWALEAGGLAVGAIVGGYLPALVPAGLANGPLVPFSIPFLLAAGLTLLGLFAVTRWMVEPPRAKPAAGERRPSIRRAIRDLPGTIVAGLRLGARDPIVRLVLGALMTFGFAIAALEIVAPVQFAALLGGEEEASGPYGILVTIAFLGTAGGSAVAPRLAAILGSGSLTAAVFTALAAAALVGMALGSAFLVVGALYVAVYFFAGVVGPLRNELLHGRVAAEQRATLLSVASLVQQLGGMAGSFMVPALAAASFGTGWLGAAAVALAGAAMLALLPRTKPASTPPPAAEPLA